MTVALKINKSNKLNSLIYTCQGESYDIINELLQHNTNFTIYSNIEISGTLNQVYPPKSLRVIYIILHNIYRTSNAIILENIVSL